METMTASASPSNCAAADRPDNRPDAPFPAAPDTTSDTPSATVPNASAAANLDSPPALLVFDLPPRPAHVRLLREADSRALEWQGGADLRAFYDGQWQSHRAGDICVLVAGLNDFPIGQVAIHWRGKRTHPHLPDLQSLRVFPAFQGMGIGSRLIETAEQMVAARGFSQVSLAVGVENPRARALYERLGFYVIGQPYDDEWHYTDAQGRQCRVVERIVDLVKTL